MISREPGGSGVVCALLVPEPPIVSVPLQQSQPVARAQLEQALFVPRVVIGRAHRRGGGGGGGGGSGLVDCGRLELHSSRADRRRCTSGRSADCMMRRERVAELLDHRQAGEERSIRVVLRHLCCG